ncbi:hypothetical protein AAE478_004173 [Parahypoxylon ruwenzoriense]
MEFAYSLSMYSPPVRVIRPATASGRKSSCTTTTNTNTSTNTYYTFVHGANKNNNSNNNNNQNEHTSHPQDKNTDTTADESNSVRNLLLNHHNSNSSSNNSNGEGGQSQHQHQQEDNNNNSSQNHKKKKKQKSSDASSTRSRIPGRRRPPPPGTLSQALAHRPASHHSHSRTSSSFSTQAQPPIPVPVPVPVPVPAQAQAQLNWAASSSSPSSSPSTTSSPTTSATTTHARVSTGGTASTTSGNLISSPPAPSRSGAKPDNGSARGASAITTSSSSSSSSPPAANNSSCDTNSQARDSNAAPAPASASGAYATAPPPLPVALTPIASAFAPSTSTPIPAFDSEPEQPTSPKSSKFIRSVHIPIFGRNDNNHHHHHHTTSHGTYQNRLHKRDSIHYQSNHIPQRPPTPTSPIHFVAALTSPIRRRSSQGKHHHDSMPIEIGQFSSFHLIRTGTMTSNENLGLSSAEGSIATSSASTSTKLSSQWTKPFVVRNGRTYIHEPTLLYPLPVDLAELHRQSLRTLMLFQLFGGPTTAPEFSNKPPSRVLEVGCGSAFWSMMCHRYFAQHGHSSISFTGLDIVPLVGTGLDQTWKPDKDMRWRFVQHDMRRTPWPLADNEFDLIMVKDMSLANLMRDPQQFFEEYLRILKPGGVLEFWESDYTIRMLRPNVLKAPAVSRVDSDSDSDSSSEEDDDAERLGAYVMTNNTPLSAPLNPFLVEYNGWATKGLDARGLSAVPCTLIGPYLLQEAETLMDVRSKRLAVPLSEIRWEREGVGGVVTKDGKSYIDSMKGKGKVPETKGEKLRGKALTAGQAALRRTALETVVGMILCLEPILKEVSGKSQDEWDGWCGKMMNDLLREGGTSWGECLEVGAWCARKKLATPT